MARNCPGMMVPEQPSMMILGGASLSCVAPHMVFLRGWAEILMSSKVS